MLTFSAAWRKIFSSFLRCRRTFLWCVVLRSTTTPPWLFKRLPHVYTHTPTYTHTRSDRVGGCSCSSSSNVFHLNSFNIWLFFVPFSHTFDGPAVWGNFYLLKNIWGHFWTKRQTWRRFAASGVWPNKQLKPVYSVSKTIMKCRSQWDACSSLTPQSRWATQISRTRSALKNSSLNCF